MYLNDTIDNMSSSHPKLRSDLNITRQVQTDGVYFVIKDPLTQEYYRFAEDEYRVISLFDGAHKLDEIVASVNKKYPELEIDRETAIQFHDSLHKVHLLEKELAEQNIFLLERLREQRKSKLLGVKGSLMYFRFSLFDPDRLLNIIYPRIKWVYSVPFFTFALLVIAAAVLIVTFNYERVAEGMRSIVTFQNTNTLSLIWLWITVVIIIFFHEWGHAFTCKHFGGEVHEIGILMLFFTPCFYANVNDAWTFEKRYQKLSVTFAGGAVEFFIGSCAAILWFFLNPATALSGIAYQIMSVCAVSSVMFNFNPLMKLDGYYAFSDFTGIPNLKTESAGYLKFLIQKHLFRHPPEEDFDQFSRREKRILLVYGICSFFYMTGIMVGLFFMVRGFLLQYLGATGVIISLFVGWKLSKGYIVRVKKFLTDWYSSKKTLFKKHLLLLTFLSLSLLFLGIYLFTIQTLAIEKQGVLKPSLVKEVLSPESGFILEHDAFPGTLVSLNQEIALIENVSTSEELSRLRVEQDQVLMSKADAMQNNDANKRLKSDLELLRLKKQIGSQEKKKVNNRILAPLDGIIVSSEIPRGYEPYFTKGAELCRVASLDTFLVEIKVLENEIGEISSGDPARIRLSGHPVVTGKIVDIAPVSLTYLDSTTQNSGAENEFMVKIEVINNQNYRLWPNMNVNVKISAGKVRGVSLLVRSLRKGLRSDLFF